MLLPIQLKNKINQYDPRVWYLFITRIFNALGFSIIIPFLSLHLHQEMDVSMSIIGSIFLVSALARASSQYITGEISDRWGRKGALLIGAIGRVSIFTFLGFVVLYNWSFLALGFGIVLSYVFGGMFFTSADAMIADIVLETDQVEAYALQRVAIHLGWAIGPAMAGFLAQVPFHFLFFMTSIILVVPVIMVQVFIKESWTIKKDVQKNKRTDISLKKIGNFLLFCVFVLLVFSVMTQIISTMAVFSVENIGISKSQLAFLFSLNGFLIVIFQFHATKLIRLVSLTFALFAGSIFIAIGFFIIPFSSGIITLVVSIIFITIGEIFVTPSGTALASRWAPKTEKGRYLGIYGLFMAFGRSIGPFYGGILMDHLERNTFLLWGIISAVPFFAGLGFRWFGTKIPKQVNNEQV
jgi:MFS family permease